MTTTTKTQTHKYLECSSCYLSYANRKVCFNMKVRHVAWFLKLREGKSDLQNFFAIK